MKRLSALIAAILIILSLSACGSAKEEATISSLSSTASTSMPASSDAATSESIMILTTESTTQTTSLTELSTTVSTTVSTTSETTTTAATTTAATTSVYTTAATTEKSDDTVTVSIDCKKILENRDKLSAEKEAFVPSDGVILEAEVELSGGETAFDVLKKACAENHCAADCPYCKNGIQLEYTFTPAYKTYYVEGIHQLYEFDCGSSSGWMYSVNGEFPQVGCSSFAVKPGDEISFSFSCDSGFDLKAPDA